MRIHYDKQFLEGGPMLPNKYVHALVSFAILGFAANSSAMEGTPNVTELARFLRDNKVDLNQTHYQSIGELKNDLFQFDHTKYEHLDEASVDYEPNAWNIIHMSIREKIIPKLNGQLKVDETLDHIEQYDKVDELITTISLDRFAHEFDDSPNGKKAQTPKRYFTPNKPANSTSSQTSRRLSFSSPKSSSKPTVQGQQTLALTHILGGTFFLMLIIGGAAKLMSSPGGTQPIVQPY